MVQLSDLSESIKHEVHATSAAARFARALEYGLAAELCSHVCRCLALSYQMDPTSEDVQQAFVDMRYDLDLLKKRDMQEFLERHRLSLVDLQSYCMRRLTGRKSLYDFDFQHTSIHDREAFTKLLSIFLLCSAPGNQFAYSCVKGDNPMAESEDSLQERLESLLLSDTFKMAVFDALRLGRTHRDTDRISTKTMIERLISLSVVSLDCYVAKHRDEVREFILSLQEDDPIVDSLVDSGLIKKETVDFPSGVLPFYFMESAGRVYTLLPGEALDVSCEQGVLAVVLRDKQQLFSRLSAHG